MFVKTNITLIDILKYIHINYDCVEEKINQLINTCKDENDFWNNFEEYFSEYGLGDDDVWEDTKRYLPLILDFTKHVEPIVSEEDINITLDDSEKNPIDINQYMEKLKNSYKNDIRKITINKIKNDFYLYKNGEISIYEFQNRLDSNDDISEFEIEENILRIRFIDKLKSYNSLWDLEISNVY